MPSELRMFSRAPIISGLSPKNSNSICFPLRFDRTSFWPVKFWRSAAPSVPRKTDVPEFALTSAISLPGPGLHCLLNHSTSANSGIAQRTSVCRKDAMDNSISVTPDFSLVHEARSSHIELFLTASWKPLKRLGLTYQVTDPPG